MNRYRFSIFILLSALLLMTASRPSFAGEKKILIFPFDASAGGEATDLRTALPVLMVSRLSVPERLAALTVEPKQQGTGQKARLLPQDERLAQAKRLGADYCLTGSITAIGDGLSIDARLISADGDGRQIPLYVQIAGKNDIIAEVTNLCTKIKHTILADTTTVSSTPSTTFKQSPVMPEAITPPERRAQEPAAGPPATMLLLPPATAVSEEEGKGAAQKPAKSLDVPRQLSQQGSDAVFEAYASQSYIIKSSALTILCIGDVDGDGRKELLVGGPEALYVYKIGAAGQLSPAQNIPLAKTERLVHIDAGDFNGNGIDEIYVSSYDGTIANSFVLEFRDNAYHRLVEKQPWFFRAYAPSGGTTVLIGQDASVGNPFAGDIVRLKWGGGALGVEEKIKLPVVCGIYSFTEADLDGDKNMEFFVFQRGIFESALNLSVLSSGGKTLWKDQHALGVTPFFFKRSVSVGQVDLKEPVPMRILCGTSASKRPIVIVAKNAVKGDTFFNSFANKTQGTACCLVWNGTSFAYNWDSGFMKDFITDYLLADADNDGEPELIVLGLTGEVNASFALNRIQLFRRR